MIAGYGPSLANFRGPLIRELVQQGNRVLAFSPDFNGGHESVRAMGAEFVSVDIDRTGVNPVRDWRTFRALKKHLANEPVDAVLAYTVKPIVLGLQAAAVVSVPVRVALVTGLGYAFGTGTTKQRLVGVAVSAMYRRALGLATAVRFQNSDDEAEFVARRLVATSKTGVVAGSGVDLTYFAQKPPPKGPKTRFLLISRLLAAKGIREYAQAAMRISRHRGDCEFHLVGPHDPNPDGLSEEEVGAWANSGLIVVHPRTDDVRPFLAECDVFVLPSYYREGVPRTVLEAMAIGRPIITTDSIGCREKTVDGENGLVVPVRDVDALERAMVVLADNRSLREAMGCQSRRIAEDRFDVRVVNRELIHAMGLSPLR